MRRSMCARLLCVSILSCSVTLSCQQVKNADSTNSSNRSQSPNLRRNVWSTSDADNCYRKGGDWSECVSPHKLYRPRSKHDILSRDPMCLFEPLCWTQFDWLNTPPPEWKCGLSSAPLEFLDLSYHDGCMTDHSSFIERILNNASSVKHRVTLHNCKKAKSASENYNFSFRVLGFDSETLECYCGTPGSEAIARAVFEESRHTVSRFDALIFTFSPSMFEHWMTFNKSMILSPAHRINMARQDLASSARTFEHVRMLAASEDPPHIIGPARIYDMEYIRHYTGIRSIYLPANLFGALGDLEGLSWRGDVPEIIVNGYPTYVPFSQHTPLMRLEEFQREFDHYELHYEFVSMDSDAIVANDQGTERLKGRALFEAMVRRRAVVVWPYSITNYRLVEQYTLGIPIYAPAPALLARLGTYWDVRVADQCPPNPAFAAAAADMPADQNSPYDLGPDTAGPAAREFWLGFAEVYHWPCVRVFDSFRSLREMLDSDDHAEISECIARANRWRRLEAEQNWCWAAGRIKPGRAVPDSYEAALRALGVEGGRLMVHD